MQGDFDITNWDLEKKSPEAFLITSEDEGKQIRANISYIDGFGNKETINTDPLEIPVRLDLADENLRKFNPGSVSNINLIDFSTLDDKLYRRFDWEEVNYGQLNALAKNDIHWDKVAFRKATRSDDFVLDLINHDVFLQSNNI